MRERLVNERLKKSLTQAEVAEKLCLSEVFVRKIEKGNRNPSVTTMLKFENFYGVSIRHLFPDIFKNMNDTKCIRNEPKEVS